MVFVISIELQKFVNIMKPGHGFVMRFCSPGRLVQDKNEIYLSLLRGRQIDALNAVRPSLLT